MKPTRYFPSPAVGGDPSVEGLPPKEIGPAPAEDGPRQFVGVDLQHRQQVHHSSFHHSLKQEEEMLKSAAAMASVVQPHQVLDHFETV